jgi:chemotaxis protein methyltransferase CheR
MQHEVMHMVDAVTTNKTDFFREPGHFDFLNQYALPELYHEFGGQKQIDIWSAGCSSGEEVYTLAMILYEFAEMIAGTGFHIQGTDISSRMLSKAVDAVYTEERIADIPMWLKKKYFLKSKDRVKKTVRVHAALRAKVEFSYLNLMDDSYAIDKNYDIIFCRNVLIYFDKTTQYHVINKLAHKLRSGGFLFLGHSETITNMQLPLVQIQPTILRKL